MTHKISMINRKADSYKSGYYGFSKTCLFFGPFVPLFRGDYKLFFLVFICIALLSVAPQAIHRFSDLDVPYFILGAAKVIGFVINLSLASKYNRHYTLSLINNGYDFNDDDDKIKEAKNALGL